MADIMILENTLLQLFNIYNDKLSNDFKLKIVNFFEKSIIKKEHIISNRYTINKSHKCNYPRTQGRGFCRRNCITKHCAFHMKSYKSSDESNKNNPWLSYNRANHIKSDEFSGNSDNYCPNSIKYDEKNNYLTKINHVKSYNFRSNQINLPDLDIIDIDFSNEEDNYNKLLMLNNKNSNKINNCEFLRDNENIGNKSY